MTEGQETAKRNNEEERFAKNLVNLTPEQQIIARTSFFLGVKSARSRATPRISAIWDCFVNLMNKD